MASLTKLIVMSVKRWMVNIEQTSWAVKESCATPSSRCRTIEVLTYLESKGPLERIGLHSDMHRIPLLTPKTLRSKMILPLRGTQTGSFNISMKWHGLYLIALQWGSQYWGITWGSVLEKSHTQDTVAPHSLEILLFFIIKSIVQHTGQHPRHRPAVLHTINKGAQIFLYFISIHNYKAHPIKVILRRRNTQATWMFECSLTCNIRYNPLRGTREKTTLNSSNIKILQAQPLLSQVQNISESRNRGDPERL